MKRFPKKLLILFAFLIVLIGGAILVIPSFIDHAALREKTQKELSDLLGHDVVIRGSDAAFSFGAEITFKDIYIKNTSEEAVSNKLFSARAAIINIGLLDFLQGNMQPDTVTLVQPLLQIEEIRPHTYNIALPESSSGLGALDLFKSGIDIQNGRIKFSPYRAESSHEIDSITTHLSLADNADDMSLKTTFYLNDRLFELGINGMNVSKEATAESPMSLSLKTGEESISYTGTFGKANNKPYAKGNIVINILDTKNWLNIFDLSAGAENTYDFLGDNVAIKADILMHYRDDAMAFATKGAQFGDDSLSLEGQVAEGKKHTKFLVKGTFDTLNFQADDTQSELSTVQLNTLLHKLLPKPVEGNINLTAKKFAYGDIHGRDAVLSATLSDGELVFNQATLNMEGDSKLILFGIMKPDANNIVHLDGNIEVLGKDIVTFMSSVNLDKHKLLANHRGSFRAKANMYLSPTQSTISEIRFQAGDFLFQGGAEYKPGAKPEHIISMQVRGGNYNSMMQYVNPTQGKGVLDNDYNVPKITLPWLDSMDSSYKVTLIVDDFKLFDKKGQRSRFVINIAPKKMGLESIDLNLEDIKFSGSLKINQQSKLPYIDANFYLSSYNLSNFTGSSLRQHPVSRGNVLSVWDGQPIDINFLKGYNGKFNMRFGQMNHPSVTMDDVAIRATVDDALWKIDNISGKIWSGRMKVKGEMNVTSILSTKMEFRMQNIMLHQFLESMLNINSIRGTVSLSGVLDTAGVSVDNLMSNLSANMVMHGKEIIIRGFDMAGLIQAIPSVRSTSEVANTTRVALVGGKTTFRLVEGAFHIADGTLNTHGLTLRSKHAIGNLTGSANLLSWVMDMMINFRLPTIAMSEFPEINLYFRDSMDNPLLQIDTRNLESFITKRKGNR